MRCISLSSLRSAAVTTVAGGTIAAGMRARATKRRVSAQAAAAKPAQPVLLQPLEGSAVQLGDVVFTYPGPLLPARLVKRYKRFLADVEVRPNPKIAKSRDRQVRVHGRFLKRAAF